MKKFFLLAAVAATAMTANADFYMIGSDVNGHDWALGEADCKFEGADGVYTWKGDFLGTGFKINDGAWNREYNIGSNGFKLALDEAYTYYNGGDSGNIAFDGFTGVNNPVVVLDINNETITVSGEKVGELEWFLTGDFNGWAIGDGEGAVKLTVNEDGLYAAKNVTLPEAGELKITSTGWADQFGSDEAAENSAEITPDALSVELQEVGGEGGACPFTLEPGAYDITWDLDEYILTLKPAGQDAVAGIAVDEVEAVYYNLQGVKVANPANGIFVKVMGKKAVKVAVAK